MKQAILLTLHKHHYKDFQDKPYISDISCLGYYDEITMEEILEDEADFTLASKNPANLFANSWYRSAKRIKKLTGEFSNLSIALFRGINNQNDYWEKSSCLPYFGLGFIKLRENDNYQEIMLKIEKDNYLRGVLQNVDEECSVITYCTLDSADVVVLVRANKLSLIEKAFRTIDREAKYLHPIIGFDESFLKSIYFQLGQEQDENLSTYTWKGNKCFLDEKIDNININLVTQGTDDVINEVLNCWSEQQAKIRCSDVRCSYILGHANIMINIKKSDVESLIRLLIADGFLPHSNVLYEKGVYNIETSLYFNENLQLKRLQLENAPNPLKEVSKDYCNQVIKKYEMLMEQKKFEFDEGFYSYAQALLLTLNAVSQYEKFSMSKDLFWLIYPSLKMFNDQIINIWQELQYTSVNTYISKMLSMKNALCEYLEAVNSVIYHTIHTDQVYLMIPGYSGTSFSIPIKLSMFYMWYVNVISDVLNDNGRKYSCILIPVTEAKPTTGIIEINNLDTDRIIFVRLSQRQLYFPRNLMIILAHEIGHYIGKTIRCRKVRAERLLRDLSYCICEGLIPEKNMFEDRIIWQYFVNGTKSKLEEHVLQLLMHNIGKDIQDKEYHSEVMRDFLKNSTINILSEDVYGEELTSLIFSISPELKEYVNEYSDLYSSRMEEVYQIQNRIDQRRKEMLRGGILFSLIDELVTMYQEIFSDVEALEILQCKIEFLEESFYVSEGVKYSLDQEDAEPNLLRKRIIHKLTDKEYETKVVSYNGVEYDGDICEYLRRNLYSFRWLELSLITYAEECRRNIRERMLSEETVLDKITELRYVYDKFTTEQISISELYKIIVEKNRCYTENVKLQYFEDLLVDGDNL